MPRSRSPDDEWDRGRRRRNTEGHRRRDKRGRRGRSHSREWTRSPSRSRSRSRDHKRRRDDSPPDAIAAARAQAFKAHAADEARKAAREREQQALDDEMEKRRKRIAAWQAQRRKLEESGGAGEEGHQTSEAPGPTDDTAPDAEASQKEWNLEDEKDLSEDDGEGLGDDPKGDASIIIQQNDGKVGGGGGIEDSSTGLVLPKVSELRRQQEEDEDSLDVFMKRNGINVEKIQVEPEKLAEQPALLAHDDDEVDPLDAFMAANVLPEVETLKAKKIESEAIAEGETGVAAPSGAVANGGGGGGGVGKKEKGQRRRPGSRLLYDSDTSSDLASSEGDGGGGAVSDEDDAVWAQKVQSGKLSKGDKLAQVDHSEVNYAPFRRNFYREVPELARMSDTEVESYRKQLDEIKVRGKDVPKPLRNWNQAGLTGRVAEVIRRAGFERPLPIQAQAVPVIMGGRDCIGIAKTGSGKTLAFVLPMIRHVKDQPPLVEGDGPVALVMAPTRELVNQISKEVKRFARAAGLNCTAVYGGSGVANQISELKRGTEIVVCTPGRMIDILATGTGKITNLRRVTYLVMDEADRMFDMGFEPQIMRIVNNVRPDRQTVLFSATFPRAVEQLARKVLTNPIEIQVGGRSVVNSDITQYVEIRPEEERFLRLLELLGQWYEQGKLLIFVSSQDRCDSLFRDLLRAGYPCLSLHGGKDQSDRESTISDFKSNVCNVLVATSVAARGLDVKDLVLVVNYDCPNHHEDYVHRVGRTGRAGAKGTAVTFIGPDEDQYSPDLVKALKESSAAVPSDLEAMALAFDSKRKAGLAKAHGSGFGGSGFKFDRAEDDQVRAAKKATAREFGIVDGSDSEEEDDGIREVAATGKAGAAGHPTDEISTGGEGHVDISALPIEVQTRIKAAHAVAEKFQTAAQSAAQSTAQTSSISVVSQNQILTTPAGGTTAVPAPPSATATPAAATTSSNPMLAAAQAAAQRLAMKMQSVGAAPNMPAVPNTVGAVPSMPAAVPSGGSQVPSNIAAAAAAALKAMGVVPAAPGATGAAPSVDGAAEPAKHYQAELEINDFPQQARWKVTHRETIREINEQMGAAIVVKGRYTKPGASLPEGERKLYLQIEGRTADVVRKAKAELKRLVEESTEKAMRREVPGVGRYSVM